MNKLILLLLVVAISQSKRVVRNHEIVEDIKQYFSNNMLSQATGGFLGSNKTLLETLGNKYLGLGQNQPQQPQNGFEGLTNAFLGKNQPGAAPNTGGFNFQQIAGKFLGGNQGANAGAAGYPQNVGSNQAAPTNTGGFNLQEIASKYLGGNQGGNAGLPQNGAPTNTGGFNFQQVASKFLGNNQAANAGGAGYPAAPNAAAPAQNSNYFSQMASNWISNKINPGAAAPAAAPAAPAAGGNSITDAVNSISNIFNGKQGGGGLLSSLYHE